ncbi:MAG: hypothetical protein IJ697_06625 [Synergistaceae bacterium]|nr:hypothetical protein [Synergistaceae bacterium]
MNKIMNTAWEYRRNSEGTFSVFPADSLTDESYVKTLIAEVLTEGIDDPEANARLISAAPEMYRALECIIPTVTANEALMLTQGLDIKEINEIISTVEALLDRISGELEA